MRNLNDAFKVLSIFQFNMNGALIFEYVFRELMSSTRVVSIRKQVY